MLNHKREIMSKKMKSLDDLAQDVTWEGKLSKEEIEYVAKKIIDQTCNNDDLSTCIYILGRSGAEQYREQIEKYIYFKSNEWVCIQALRTLCTYWLLTNDYLEEIKMYIKGADWDDTDDIRIHAIGIAGNYLRKNHDSDLLRLLVEIFETPNHAYKIHHDDALTLIKSCAYEALARAMGKEWNEILDVDEILYNITNEKWECLDMTIIREAKNRINFY